MIVLKFIRSFCVVMCVFVAVLSVAVGGVMYLDTSQPQHADWWIFPPMAIVAGLLGFAFSRVEVE